MVHNLGPWTRIQVQGLTKTEPYICRNSDKKKLTKLNNTVKTFVIKNDLNKYPLSLSIHLEFLDNKTWNALVAGDKFRIVDSG